MTIGRAMSLALVAALATAGCGKKDGDAAAGNESASATTPAAPAAAALDPCSLVTSEEVAAITGDKVVKSSSDHGTCTYATDDSDGATITVDTADAAGKMKIDRDSAKLLGGMGAAVADKGGAGADVNAKLHEGGDSQPGLGDDSLWGMNSQLSVRKGGTYVAATPPGMHSRISYSGNPLISDDDKRKMAVALAEKALSRVK